MPAQKGLQAQPTYRRGRQSFQPGQNPMGKAGTAAVCDSVPAPTQNDTHVPMSHPLGAHGQCRQPYHRCDHCHRVSFVSSSIPPLGASLAWGAMGWSGSYIPALALLG